MYVEVGSSPPLGEAPYARYPIPASCRTYSSDGGCAWDSSISRVLFTILRTYLRYICTYIRTGNIMTIHVFYHSSICRSLHVPCLIPASRLLFPRVPKPAVSIPCFSPCLSFLFSPHNPCSSNPLPHVRLILDSETVRRPARMMINSYIY